MVRRRLRTTMNTNVNRALERFFLLMSFILRLRKEPAPPFKRPSRRKADLPLSKKTENKFFRKKSKLTPCRRKVNHSFPGLHRLPHVTRPRVISTPARPRHVINLLNNRLNFNGTHLPLTGLNSHLQFRHLSRLVNMIHRTKITRRGIGGHVNKRHLPRKGTLKIMNIPLNLPPP